MTHDHRICPICEQDSRREVWHHALWFTVLGLVGARHRVGLAPVSNRWREGTPAWERMREHSPNEWDGISAHSPSAFRVNKYIATCIACGRTVEPTERVAWCRAVQTLQCEHCHGRLLVEIENVGGLQSATEVRIQKRTDDRPLRTRVA